MSKQQQPEESNQFNSIVDTIFSNPYYSIPLAILLSLIAFFISKGFDFDFFAFFLSETDVFPTTNNNLFNSITVISLISIAGSLLAKSQKNYLTKQKSRSSVVSNEEYIWFISVRAFAFFLLLLVPVFFINFEAYIKTTIYYTLVSSVFIFTLSILLLSIMLIYKKRKTEKCYNRLKND